MPIGKLMSPRSTSQSTLRLRQQIVMSDILRGLVVGVVAVTVALAKRGLVPLAPLYLSRPSSSMFRVAPEDNLPFLTHAKSSRLDVSAGLVGWTRREEKSGAFGETFTYTSISKGDD